MNLKLQFVGAKNNLKAALILIVFIAFQSNVIVAQDTEVKEEKTEKKEKVKKEKAPKEEKVETAKIGVADKNAGAVKYRRSSLHTMIIEDAKLPKFDIILKTFNEAEFPDKYNNHTVGDKTFNLEQYYVGHPESADGEKVSKKEEKDLSPSINKYFADNKIANKIVAKWFNRSADGAFDMSLIGERGSYDASAQDAAKALSTERGTSMLADAGEELIPNTFVVVNYSKFVENEPIARAIKKLLMLWLQNLLKWFGNLLKLLLINCMRKQKMDILYGLQLICINCSGLIPCQPFFIKVYGWMHLISTLLKKKHLII